MDDYEQITEDIFGNLGLDIDSPKDYVISIINFMTNKLKEYDWFQGYGIEDYNIDNEESNLSLYISGLPDPILIDISVSRSMDYNRLGVMYLIYDICINVLSEIEYYTDKYERAEEYLFATQDIMESVYKQAIEVVNDNIYLLKGEVSNGIELSIIPLSSDNLAEDITENWSDLLKEKTNFKTAALEISNVPKMINDHYQELVKIINWFNSRGIHDKYLFSVQGDDSESSDFFSN